MQKKMNTEELSRFKQCLEYFGVDTEREKILLTSGGNSVILNKNSEYSDFLGCSINSIAEAYADQVGKEKEWEKEYYDFCVP